MKVAGCQKIGILILVCGLIFLPAHAVDFAQRSISHTRQFIIYCADVSLRIAVTGYVETVKSFVLESLDKRDHWKVPVVINLERPATTATGVPLCRTRFLLTDEGAKLEIDIALREDQFREVHFPQQIIRVLLMEMAYRDHPPADGEHLASPPAWLVEGLAERFQIRATDNTRDAAMFKQLIDTGRLPKLRDFLRSNVEAMDSTSRTVYAACASSLLEMLFSLPGGKASLARMVHESPNFADDPVGLLVKNFPTLGEGEAALEKWWTLGLARASAADRFLGLTVPENNGNLGPLLTLQVVTDEKKGTKATFTLADFKQFMKFRTAKAALFTQGNALAALQARAHPLMRPVVLEYQRITSELARGNSRGIETALNEVANYRTLIVGRMDKIADYLNWFEATQMPERSGAFDNYLKAAAALDHAQPPKRDDPLSRYVDQVEREFE